MKSFRSSLLVLGAAVGLSLGQSSVFAQQVFLMNFDSYQNYSTNSASFGLIWTNGPDGPGVLQEDCSVTLLGGTNATNLTEIVALTLADGSAYGDVSFFGEGLFFDPWGWSYTVPGVADNGWAVLELRLWLGNSTNYDDAVAAGASAADSGPFYNPTGGGGTPPSAPAGLMGMPAMILSTPQSQQQSQMTTNDNGTLMPGEGRSGGTNQSPYTSDSTSDPFYMTIARTGHVASVLVTMHGLTNNHVYELMSTRALVGTGSVWSVEQSVHGVAGQASTVTVPMLDRTNRLFLLARDWTTNDDNANGLPDWWEWENFGSISTNFNQSAAGDYDGDGVNNGDEYTNRIDPNKIAFTVRLGNQHFNTTQPAGQFLVLNGEPFFSAILVNDTNRNDAVWSAYTGTAAFTLGSTDGVYQVLLGLKGRAPNSEATWFGTSVTLDRSSPSVVITSPTTTNLTKPMIQVQGYSLEPLWSVSGTLSNSAGLQTNLSAFLTGGSSPPTNCFQVFDVPLTNGENLISLRVTDYAGNETATNLHYMLDLTNDTTPPVIGVLWPQDGARIGTANFTLQGSVDDETATVTVSGLTPEPVQALVERNGTFWVQNLPLADGSNTLSVTATDAAGNSSTNTLSVVKSDVTLTIDINGLADYELNQPNVTVHGAVSDSSYSVTVNDRAATVFGDGSWTATNVPVNEGGTAVFVATATNGGGGNFMARAAGGTSHQATEDLVNPDNITSLVERDKPCEVKVTRGEWHAERDQFDMGEVDDYFDISRADWSWDASVGGHALAYHAQGSWTNIAEYWFRPDKSAYTIDTNGNPVDCGQPTEFGVGWQIDGPLADGKLEWWHPTGGNSPYSYACKSAKDVIPVLFTRSKATAQKMNRYVLRGSATEEITGKYVVFTNGPTVLPEQFTVPDFGSLDSTWLVSAELPANAQPAIPPQVNVPSSQKTLEATGRKLIIKRDDMTNITDSTTSVFVGQRVSLNCYLVDVPGIVGVNPPDPTNYQWTVPGYAIAGYSPDANSGTVNSNFSTTSSNVGFYWVDGQSKQVACTAEAAGKEYTANATFNVLRPEATWTLTPRGNVAVDTNYCNPSVPGCYYLHCGRHCSTNDVGMLFEYHATDLKGYSGVYNFQFVQIVTIDWKENLIMNNQPSAKFAAMRGLDTAYPYDNQKWFFGSDYATDSPISVLLDYQVFSWRRDSFESYLLFQPQGGIPVPIKMATWSWYGRAQEVGPDLSDVFVGRPPFTDPQPAVGTDCLTFPQWTNNIPNDVTWTYQDEWFPTP